jgi:peptidylprolyl isomerase
MSGDTVWVKYRLTLNNGTQVDGNFDSDTAFDFTIDQQWIITGFSEAVKGMKIWDKKTVKLAPSDAYWEYDENNTQIIPKKLLTTFVDAGIKLEKWNTLPTERGNFLIKDVNETDVIIDTNHSLAGKELNFELELKYFVN